MQLIDIYASQPTEEELKLKFLNTVLEPYTQYIYTFWISEPVMEIADSCHEDFRQSVIAYIKECLQIAKCIKQTRSGVIMGRGWKINGTYDSNLLISKLELYLIEKLEGFEIIFHGSLPEETEKYSTARIWCTALKPFPRVRNLPINYVDYIKGKTEWNYFPHFFDAELITDIISNLEECVNITKSFSLEHDISASVRFIAFMIDNGVPMTREAYRELYKALDLYDCIPEEVKRSHEKTTSYDPQSNYVKSLAMTAKSKLDIFD